MSNSTFVQHSRLSVTRQVCDNPDIMMLIVSYLVRTGPPPSSSNEDYSLVLKSPMLPLALAFRCLYVRLIDVLATNRKNPVYLESHIGHFTTSVSLMKFAIDMGCDTSHYLEVAAGCAARQGSLDVLIWLQHHQPSLVSLSKVWPKAVVGGHLAVLKWIYDHTTSIAWNGYTCSNAASNGHLEVLQWLRSQDPPCPWDEYTCSEAARNGHLEVL